MKALTAEFIGTFALIFVGVGSIAVGAGLVGVALAHGLTIAVMVSATMAISGGHLNPAVTVGAWVGKKIETTKAIGYIIAQCLGAIVAAWLITVIIPDSMLTPVKMGTPVLGSGISPFQGMLAELVLTFFLVFAVYGTAIDPRSPKVGGLFIGLTVTLGVLVGGPLTGAAMNPARHLGPALLGGGLENIWIYWVGPVLGGALAGLVYHHVLENK